MPNDQSQASGIKVALAMAFPWLAYNAILAVLSVFERRTTPEAVDADRFLDLTLNYVAFVGLIVAAALSVVAMKSGHHTVRRGTLLAGVLVGGIVGPLLGTVVATAIAQDVDGGGWMLFSPALGFLCVLLTMFAMAVIEARHRSRRMN